MIDPNHYFDPSYNTKERFCSYWHQIAEIVALKPRRLLEIGIGNGFVADYLRKRKFPIFTMDIDWHLRPDIGASVLMTPFQDAYFELVACYEVLEHLPFSCFSQALAEIWRISSCYALLSLPDSNRHFPVYIKIPRYGIYKKIIPLFRLRQEVHEFEGEHYWEIGKADYPLSKITGAIKKAGFHILKTYRVFEFPYHRMFILRKQEHTQGC